MNVSVSLNSGYPDSGLHVISTGFLPWLPHNSKTLKVFEHKRTFPETLITKSSENTADPWRQTRELHCDQTKLREKTRLPTELILQKCWKYVNEKTSKLHLSKLTGSLTSFFLAKRSTLPSHIFFTSSLGFPSWAFPKWMPLKQKEKKKKKKKRLYLNCHR